MQAEKIHLLRPGRRGHDVLGCNSIDINNLRLFIVGKLRQGLSTRLGMHFLAVG